MVSGIGRFFGLIVELLPLFVFFQAEPVVFGFVPFRIFGIGRQVVALVAFVRDDASHGVVLLSDIRLNKARGAGLMPLV